jgi:ribonuclease E
MSAVHSSAAAGSIAHKQTQPRRAQLPAVRLPRRAAPAAWRVAAKKQGSAKKQDSKLQVPDSPPSRGAEEPAEEPAAAAASTSEAAAAPAEPQEVGGRMTAEEIQRQMGELRAAAKEEAKKDGLIEVRPKPAAQRAGSPRLPATAAFPEQLKKQTRRA